MSELSIFFKPLLLTILFESLAALILRIRDKKDLILIVLVNILTNPALVYICLVLMYYLGIGKTYLITYIILEPIVIYVEYLMYRKYLNSNINCLKLSIILNIISIIGGILC